jgi:ABC-type multidrug transport system fused ATPase/permease subunit
VDRILVVQDGRIVEEGGHEALYDAGGLYRELYDLQMEGNSNGGAS